MTIPLRAGAFRAPKINLPAGITGAALQRVAVAATALAVIMAAGTSSAMFVDYLADRATARMAAAAAAAESPAKQVLEPAATIEAPEPVVAAAKAAATETTVVPSVADQRAGPAATKSTAVALAAKAAPSPTRPVAPPELAAEPRPAGASGGGFDAVRAEKAQMAIAAAKAPPAEVVASEPEPLLVSADSAAPDETPTAAISATATQAGEAAAEPGDAPPESAGENSSRSAKVTDHVNMRSKPADEAKVLTVVPANASVTVLSCESWCEVEYAGQKGFIYKRFIGRS